MLPSLFRFTFKALGGPNEIQLYAPSQPEAGQVADQIISDVLEIEARYSRYRPDSLISRINAASGTGQAIEVDAETAGLLDYAALCWKESGGLFDLTSGVLRKVWDFKNPKIPKGEEIQAILSLIGWEKVKWQKPCIELSKGGMELDLGGIGKEYCVDRAAGRALARGVQHGLINLGGDIRILGPHPNGSPWMVGIAHPREKDALLTSVNIFSGALATSGDYERFFELDGKRYSHILNPKTGYPVSSFQSVSVMCESCLVAGSTATIAMLLGEKRGQEFLRQSRLPAIVVDMKGKRELL